MKLLHIDSSALGTASVSRQLTARIAVQWQAAQPGTVVEYLDLVAHPPSHLAAVSLGFRMPAGTEGLSDAQRRENALPEALVSQFLAADVVVIGAPMYNFSVPSQLKAWIDRIAQAGRTFKYTDKGPQGLAGGKTVVVVSSRGGAYGDVSAYDHQESYLKTVLGFLGVTDVRIVRAEGLAMGDTAKTKALDAAGVKIRALSGNAANESAVTVAA